MTVIRRSTSFVLVLLLLLFLFANVAHSKEKPEIVRLDAEYTEMLVKINVHWQSSNPVTIIRAIVGKEQKELKVDEYDNRRNPDGLHGGGRDRRERRPRGGAGRHTVRGADRGRPSPEERAGDGEREDFHRTRRRRRGDISGSCRNRGRDVERLGRMVRSGDGASSRQARAGGIGPAAAVPAKAVAGSLQAAAPGGAGPRDGTTGQGKWRIARGRRRGAPTAGLHPPGTHWSKAQQGTPGELIDKTIGFVGGSGKSAAVPRAPWEPHLPSRGPW